MSLAPAAKAISAKAAVLWGASAIGGATTGALVVTALNEASTNSSIAVENGPSIYENPAIVTGLEHGRIEGSVPVISGIDILTTPIHTPYNSPYISI